MTFKEFITVLILAILTGLDQWELRRRLRKGNVDAQTIHARSMVNLTSMLMQSTIIIIIRSVAAERHPHRRHFHYSHLDAIL